MSEIGKVLWFDRKKGFGFVQIVNPESSVYEKELFVHYSSINCENSFKILYPGETVSLNVEKNTEQGEDQKEYLTSNVSGVYGTKLMIDNERYIFKVIRKSSRNNFHGQDDEEDEEDADNEVPSEQ